MSKLRLAVIGAGQFGRNHCRVIHESERADLRAVVDLDPSRAAGMATLYGAQAVAGLHELAGQVDAAVVAVPTTAHEEVAATLLDARRSIGTATPSRRRC